MRNRIHSCTAGQDNACPICGQPYFDIEPEELEYEED